MLTSLLFCVVAVRLLRNQIIFLPIQNTVDKSPKIRYGVSRGYFWLWVFQTLTLMCLFVCSV